MNDFMIKHVLQIALCYMMLFSVEEIVLGFITRLIWRHQYRF